MFYKIDMNFTQTFQVTNYIIGENKNELIKLLLSILAYGAITTLVMFGVSTNIAVGSSIILMYIIVTPMLITYLILYFRKLFYNSMYEKKESKQEVKAYVKKTYWKFVGYSTVIGIVYAIINSSIFAPIVSVITSPLTNMIENMLNSSNDGVGNVMSVIAVVFIQTAITIILTTPVKYIYTYLKLEVSVYEDKPDFNSAINVVKHKTKEMFKCVLWNVIAYCIMVGIFSVIFIGIVGAVNSVTAAFLVLGVLGVICGIALWYMEMIVMVKYYNMKNMLGESK